MNNIKTKFKHGIIKYPPNISNASVFSSNSVHIELSNQNKILCTIVQGNYNYLIELTQPYKSTTIPEFLFVKINPHDLSVEYEIKEEFFTEYTNLPTNSSIGKIAYSINDNSFYEFTDLNEWEEVLGLFLIKNKKLIQTGSQIGIFETVVSHKIKLSEKLLPIRILENGKFRFLLESDSIKIENSLNSIKFKNIFHPIKSSSPLQQNQILSIMSDGTVTAANSLDRENKVVGICSNFNNSKASLITEGIVRSEDFNFSEVGGTLLFLNESSISPIPPEQGFIQEVGYVLDRNSFYFKLGQRILVDLLITPSVTPSITPSITPTITPTVTPSMAGVIQTWFSEGGQGIWYEPSPQTCFTDINGTVPANDGDSVAYMVDSSGSGFYVIESTLATRPILRFDGTISKYYLEFSGTQNIGTDNSSIPNDWIWLHDGTEWLSVAHVQFGTIANPDAAYTLFATTIGATASTGTAVSYDDRASASRNDSSRLFVAKGTSGTAVLDLIVNNTTPPNSPIVMSVGFASPYTGNDGEIFVNGSNVAASEINSAPVSTAPSGRLVLGSLANGSLPMVGRIYELVILRGTGSRDIRTQVESEIDN